MEKVLLVAGIAVLLGASIYMMNQDVSASTQIQTQVDPQVYDLYQDWKQKYNKKYATPDLESYRLSVFNNNYGIIKSFYEGPEQTYTLDFNMFMDITSQEFSQTYLGLTAKAQSGSIYQASGEATPNSVDWRDKGVINEVKNQGQCGSCWAFSAVGAIESALAIAGQGLQSLSEQELCDCSRGYGNGGCQGGLMDFAFQYVIDSGITTEAEYPYRARDQKCAKKTNEFKISSFSDVPAGDCESLASALVKTPVSVAVDANNWQFYNSGVFSTCGNQLDHGVVLVAFDNEAWTIRNSWASGWGEQGHIRLAKGNTCGICDAASFPIA